jgi:hypothetical protein
MSVFILFPSAFEEAKKVNGKVLITTPGGTVFKVDSFSRLPDSTTRIPGNWVELYNGKKYLGQINLKWDIIVKPAVERKKPKPRPRTREEIENIVFGRSFDENYYDPLVISWVEAVSLGIPVVIDVQSDDFTLAIVAIEGKYHLQKVSYGQVAEDREYPSFREAVEGVHEFAGKSSPDYRCYVGRKYPVVIRGDLDELS